MAGGDDPVLVVMPSDHVIADPARFRETVARPSRRRRPAARHLRHRADGTETGYGYIQTGAAHVRVATPMRSRASWRSRTRRRRSIPRFRRLPLEQRHLRHARVRLARADGAAPARHPRGLPGIGDRRAAQDRDFLRVGRPAFAACPSDSIDYAVMEKLVAGDGGDAWRRDAAGGRLVRRRRLGRPVGDRRRRTATATCSAATSCAWLPQHPGRAEGRLVACVGLDDIVVVETPDAVLVGHATRLQRVKKSWPN